MFDGEEEFIQSALDALEREGWEIMLRAAQTGAVLGSPGINEAKRRFWLQWLAGEGLLNCVYCGKEFGSLEAVREHEDYECEAD